jgi:hypothetical protein
MIFIRILARIVLNSTVVVPYDSAEKVEETGSKKIKISRS